MLTEQQILRIDSIVKEAVLKEFMQPSFDWEALNSLLDNGSVDDAIDYCTERLGEPIGEGTDRIVYEIDDYTVLKLCNSNNTEQNEREWEVYQKCKGNPLLPKIYGHAEDFTWIWCERVVECKPLDFEKILGIPYRSNTSSKERRRQWADRENYQGYDEPNDFQTQTTDDWGDEQKLSFVGFLAWYESYTETSCNQYPRQVHKAYLNWLKHPWFQNLIQLCQYQRSTEFFVNNLGIAMRGGKPTIVVLDVGWFD